MMNEGGGQLDLSSRQRDILFEAVRQTIGDVQPDTFLTLKIGGDAWILVVIEQDVRLLRPDGDRVEVLFLGPLRGAYSEMIAVDGDGLRADLHFEDDRLPGGRLDISSLPRSSTHVREIGEREREAAIERLRVQLRDWADDEH
jgi:hypothetical protein